MRELSILVLAALVATPVAAQPQLTTVRVAMGLSITAADGYFAYDGGFFKKHGLDVQVTQMRGGAAEASALAGNGVDIADGNVISFATAFLKGVPFVGIAQGFVYNSRDPFVVLAVANNSPIRTAKDLDGKIIGEPSLGGMAEAALAAWTDPNGGDHRTLKYTEIPAPESIAALELGRIDAVVLQDPQLGADVGRYRILARNYDAIAPRFYTSLWWTTTGYAIKNRDVVKRFQEAVTEASAWADQNPAAAKAVLEKWLKVPLPKLRHLHTNGIEPALLQPLLVFGAKYQMLSRTIKASELIYAAPR